jgi:hypothetical protein
LLQFLITYLVYFAHCIVCPSNLGFWLPIWYLQTFLTLVLCLLVNNVLYNMIILNILKWCSIRLDSHLSCREFMFYLPVQSVLIASKVVSSNATHGEVHSIQHYVIKIVSIILNILKSTIYTGNVGLSGESWFLPSFLLNGSW